MILYIIYIKIRCFFLIKIWNQNIFSNIILWNIWLSIFFYNTIIILYIMTTFTSKIFNITKYFFSSSSHLFLVLVIRISRFWHFHIASVLYIFLRLRYTFSASFNIFLLTIYFIFLIFLLISLRRYLLLILAATIFFTFR